MFPLLLLHRLRRRPVAGAEHARLRLPERLHGVPVRLRAAPVGRVRRRLHGLRRRAGLRGRLRAPAAARRAEPDRDRARLQPGGDPALVHHGDAADHRSPSSPGCRWAAGRSTSIGLYTLAADHQRLRLPLGGRDRDAAADGPGRAADADAGLPAPLPRARSTCRWRCSATRCTPSRGSTRSPMRSRRVVASWPAIRPRSALGFGLAAAARDRLHGVGAPRACARPRRPGRRRRRSGGRVTRCDPGPESRFRSAPRWDGNGTNFSLTSENAERVELCLFDDADVETRLRAPAPDGPQLARLPPGRRPGPALRLPRLRALGARAGAPLQPQQAPDRPLREGDRGAGALGSRPDARVRRRRRPRAGRDATTPRRSRSRS